MKKIIFTFCGFLILSSMAVELNIFNDTNISTDEEISKSGKFSVNLEKAKHRRGDLLEKKAIERKTNFEPDIDVKQMINQGVLDYTTQPITPYF